MTDYNHPVLPTQEQLTEWDSERFDEGENFDAMMVKAFQAGADQQLEQCRLWLLFNGHEKAADEILDALRPKTLTQKEKISRGLESAYKSGQIEEDLYAEILQLISLLPDEH